ncbi:hypothetical protein AB1Y20_013243 [Prymnesium parvum]|uniref:Integral membrane protein n=1 Tax=Prymnesium parvum TaxID=97485 RepID=A0AB34IL19_PRYPA
MSATEEPPLSQEGRDDEDSEPPDWATTNEAVRDLHRCMASDGERAPRYKASVTLENLDPTAYRLYPEVGSASDVAKPGGFRRAHVMPTLTGDAAREAYAAKSLMSHLEACATSTATAPPPRHHRDRGFTPGFVTNIVEVMADGTEVRYESRAFRLGRAPRIRRASDLQVARQPYRVCGYRPQSAPYWVAVTFLLGAILFVEGSFLWMTPLGDMMQGAPEWRAVDLVTIPFFAGSIFFTTGCYLTFVEVVNSNLQVELKIMAPERKERSQRSSSALSKMEEAGLGEKLLEEPSLGMSKKDLFDGKHKIRWWGWQPDSLLYWAALVQLFGAICFNVACASGFPGVLDFHFEEIIFVYTPSLVGSMCFTFACFVYIAEVTHSFNVLQLPQEITLSYFVVVFNLLGSALFAVASAFYFAQWTGGLLEGGGKFGWEFQLSEWGVRFTYGVGSSFFVLAAALSFPELLND